MHGETQVAGVAGTIACKQAMIGEAAVDRSRQSSPTVPPPNDHNRLPQPDVNMMHTGNCCSSQRCEHTTHGRPADVTFPLQTFKPPLMHVVEVACCLSTGTSLRTKVGMKLFTITYKHLLQLVAATACVRCASQQLQAARVYAPAAVCYGISTGDAHLHEREMQRGYTSNQAPYGTNENQQAPCKSRD